MREVILVHIRTRRRRRRRLSGTARLFAVLLVMLLLALGFLWLLNERMNPLVTRMAVSRVTNAAVSAINDAVNEEIASGSADYDSLVTVETDSEGRAVALKTNMAQVNRLKADLLSEIIRRISESDTAELGIPLGSVLGSGLFAGRGPVIPVRVLSVSSANATFQNVFTSAGINQTRHQIILNVRISVGILLPWYTTSTEVDTDVSVAETVLIGSVPESYAYFENVPDASTAADDYYNLP